ncbi:MAG: ADP-ribosylglycohydrolase family protein [Anaerolineae bacterium]|nr:ADP-ribosylglycohydrolase family protein [Anaerolineae bacterium]
MAELPPNYDEQVYAALLGKVIGVQYGGPIEGWTDERIWETYGELTGYVQHYHYFRPDDDLSGPLVFIRALADFGASEDLTPQDIGNTWLNYLGDGHCTLWWGGYGVSTEHTAYLNLAHGIPAPRSGSIAQNGQVVAEQIGGQIFTDTWGLVCPGDPEKAARYARKAASVSHDGNGIYGGMFIAGIEAAAFVEKRVGALLEIGLGLIPPGSTYAQVVRDVMGWSAQYGDWRDCFARIKARHGYDRYGGGCHIIPNAAVVVMALAYSGDDFTRALHVANMAGWDTDCNVGNVGCIMGLVAGLEGIRTAPTDWFSDVNDHVLASLILGSECILDIPNAALTVANLGRAVAGLAERRTYKGGAKYHWALPGSTHCWEVDRAPGQAAVQEIENTSYNPEHGARYGAQAARGLKVVMRRLAPGNLGIVYRKTFFTGDDIARSGYDIGTSPIIYPGQEVRASVYLSVGQDVCARLFVRDFASGEIAWGEEMRLAQGALTEFHYRIPGAQSAWIDRLGIAFSAPHETTAVAYLDRVDWTGAADCEIDLSGPEPMLGWGYLRGRWFGRGGALNGSHYGQDAEAYTGLLAWRDYRYEVQLTAHCGERHRILFRVRGAQRSYAFGLAPGGRVAFEVNWQGYREVASAPFAWELQRAYTLAVEVRGAHMTGWVDGEPVLSWEDPQETWQAGCVGLGLRDGRTLFARAALRPLE